MGHWFEQMTGWHCLREIATSHPHKDGKLSASHDHCSTLDHIQLEQAQRHWQNHLELHVDELDYLEFVNPRTLEPVKELVSEIRIVLAAWVGSTRLLDNITFSPQA